MMAFHVRVGHKRPGVKAINFRDWDYNASQWDAFIQGDYPLAILEREQHEKT
jgi:hypothetical protein